AVCNQQPLHVASPLRQSLPLTKEAGTAVYLKLDSSQPTGSFKIRGIGHLCQTVGAPGTMSFRPSTGGNAGMAAATLPVRWEVECRATIVVPSLFTPDLTVGASEGPGRHSRRSRPGGEFIVHGQQLVENNPGWVFISPFDDPLIWEGHSSLVKELQQELREKPGAIVLSVGGGGLLNGVVQGLRRAAWGDVPVVAMETRGAHSLNAAVVFLGGGSPTLLLVPSVATTLGLARVSERTFALVQEHPVFSEVGDGPGRRHDEKLLVEPACGARPWRPVYTAASSDGLQEEGKLAESAGGVRWWWWLCVAGTTSRQQLQKLSSNSWAYLAGATRRDLHESRPPPHRWLGSCPPQVSAFILKR
uniref:L-serine ammonia-lyase n=1 Tax=Takifugu rubripes TaxID=31033 RepID=A0A674NFH8_TAKRU